jgi:formate dehydrogenase major subunit
LTIESRRGSISLYARADDDGAPRDVFFVPFCFQEAAPNMLTNPVLDPFGKIPEFKYCAVKLTKGGPSLEHMSFGGGVFLPKRQPAPER